jgi:hypothetical protein
LAGAVLAAAHGGFELDIGPQFLGLENVMLLGKCGEALEKRVDQLGGGCIEECLEGRLRDRVGSGEVTSWVAIVSGRVARTAVNGRRCSS